jgi:hypothetical protein
MDKDGIQETPEEFLQRLKEFHDEQRHRRTKIVGEDAKV